jgi:hypothetical protein
MTSSIRLGGSSLLTGLVGWWSLDEASGNFTDSSGNGNTGVPTQTSGTEVSAYSEPGLGASTGTSVHLAGATSATEGRIDMGDPVALRLTSQGSVSVWVKEEAPSSSIPGFVVKMNFGSDRNGYGVFEASAHPSFEICDASGFNSSTCTGTTMVDGNVYHIVFTWDGSTIRGYVNGTADAAAVVSQTHNATSTGFNFILGRGFNGVDYTNFGYEGWMDAVGVWNRALTAAEVTTLYNSGAGKQYPF